MKAVVITNKKFAELIGSRTQTFLSLARYLSELKTAKKVLTRPLLGQLLSQSIQLEELLDAYDARNNCSWCQFRSLIAAVKSFSDVSYELLHIQHALPAYQLLPIKQNFVAATRKALEFTGDVIFRTTCKIMDEARKLGLPIPPQAEARTFDERLPAGRLPHNCKALKEGSVSETVKLLATAFLNLAAESEQVRAACEARPEQYAGYVSESASEKSLRALELRFHNLQSLYDTFVSGTELEKADIDLPVLRGHISVVFHLLRTATAFAHYYERHLLKPVCELQAGWVPLVDTQLLLAVLVNYSVGFSGHYIGCARRLCQQMLRHYAEVGRIEVNVPPYRGFHVRPATLISKLVLHYGSEVKMELEGEKYDASMPLDLFRANEKINAGKRYWLANEIISLKLVPQQAKDKQIPKIVRDIITRLAEGDKLLIYERNLKLTTRQISKEGAVLEKVTGLLAQLLATGKIDISTDIKVAFTGDKRVLADIKLLAETGYGEDNFGNNIKLPRQLAYLRR